MSYINKRGSVCRSASEREGLVEGYHASGESKALYCSKNKISPQTFYSWLKSSGDSGAKKGKNKKRSFINLPISEPRPIASSVERTCSLNIRVGSVLSLEFSRSFKCPTE